MWQRFLRATYRKEPVSSFILTVGAVDAVIGGVDTQWSLMLLGLGAIGVAIAIRIWKTQNSAAPPSFSTSAPVRYLPPQQSRPLPSLNPSRKRPTQ